MELNKDELQTVYAVLHELLNEIPYDKLNTYLGSLTIKCMIALYQKVGRELHEDRNDEW